MKTVYVIAVKRLYDCEGNILNRWEYVSGAGYTFWDKSVDGALHFYTINKLKKWFDEIGYGVIFRGVSKEQYDLNSLCIKSVVFRDPIVNFVKDLDYKK
jgi:hypothetical protein